MLRHIDKVIVGCDVLLCTIGRSCSCGDGRVVKACPSTALPETDFFVCCMSCSGQYTFNQAALEAGDMVVQAVFTANNLMEADAVVPQLTATAVQKPKLALVTSEPQCTLHFWGEL